MMINKYFRYVVISTLCVGIVVVFKMKMYGIPAASLGKQCVYNEPIWYEDNNAISGSRVEKCQPSHQVFFLKVHKAGSSTTMNLIARYGIRNNLVFALPKAQNYINRLGPVDVSVFVPAPPGRRYDLLCNHAVYNRTVFRSLFSHNTKYLGIVREPFSQFISAFLYYRVNRKISGFHPVRKFLMHPEKYRFKKGFNFVHNRMLFDFGLDSKYFNNQSKVIEHIKMIERDFDLILILEYFVESLVLLRRRFCWTIKDIISLPLNINHHRSYKYVYSFEDHDSHRNFAKADYTLYKHFLGLFWRYVFEYGPDFFEEVNFFRNVIKRVMAFCALQQSSASPEQRLFVPGSKWNSPFDISATDCKLIKMPEMKMMSLLRDIQARTSSVPLSPPSSSLSTASVN